MASGRLRGAGLHRQPRPRRRLGRRRPRHPDGRAQGQLAAAAADRPRQPPARRAQRGDPRPRQPLRISRSARRARRDRRGRARPRESSAPARSTCSPSTSWPSPAPAPFDEAEMLAEVRGAAPYAGLSRRDCSPRSSPSSRPAAMRCKAYDKFQRLTREPDGRWRITQPALHPAAPDERRHHRRRAAARRPLPQRPQARHGRGQFRLDPVARRPPSSSPAWASRSSRSTDTDMIVRASSKSARIPTYGGARMAMSTHLADRVRHFLADRDEWHALPRRRARMARGAGPALDPARARPIAGRDLPARASPLHGRLQLRGLERAPVAGHADHPADGERGPEAAGLRLQRLCARLLRPRADRATRPRSSRPTSSSTSSSTGSQNSSLLKRAFREVAVIGGLVERHHPGQAQDRGARSSFSTDLIYDVLRRYEPDHLLLQRRLGRRPRPDDRRSAASPGCSTARRATMVHVEAGPGLADGGAGDGHHRPRSDAARRRSRRNVADSSGSARPGSNAALTSLSVKQACASSTHEALDPHSADRWPSAAASSARLPRPPSMWRRSR